MQLCKKICKNYFDNTCQILSYKFFRFVLYQLSKNLNRPFFMDFLTQLSIRYTEKSAVVDEEDPDDQGEEIKCVCFWTTGCPTIEYSLCFGCFSASSARTEVYFTIFIQPRRRLFQNSPYFPPYVKNWSSYRAKREATLILDTI